MVRELTQLTRRWGWLIVLAACGTEHAASDGSDWRPVASTGALAVYDALAPAFRVTSYARDPECALCGENPTITRPGWIPG